MRKTQAISLLCLLSGYALVCCLLFIFTNSLRDGVQSGKTSSSVVDAVKPIVDPKDKIKKEDFHFAVRKTAHGLEFCLLTFCASALTLLVKIKEDRFCPYLPLTVAMMTAVADEFLQSHTQRTSSIADVMIDLSGSLVGFLLCFGIAGTVRLIAVHKAKKGVKT